MTEFFQHHSDAALLAALKTSARAYLFMARHYDAFESTDYMLEKWAEILEVDHEGNFLFSDPYFENTFDDEIDPSRFIRVMTELTKRYRAGTLENPALARAVSSIQLMDEFNAVVNQDHDNDVADLLARRILRTLDQPIPGKLRLFLGAWGLAPR